jgi:hypothetical protein
VLHYKEKRKKRIIFITGLHNNKPQGCGAAVASAAEPFTTQKESRTTENANPQGMQVETGCAPLYGDHLSNHLCYARNNAWTENTITVCSVMHI